MAGSSRPWIVLALAATVVAAATWIVVRQAAPPDAGSPVVSVQPPVLPALPDLRRQNPASVALFREADTRARASADDADAVGRLGMLYHAYRFADEARACYRLATRLEPDAYAWIYYRAHLEKSVFDYVESERLFERAIELRPDEAELWAELGDLYLRWAKREEAESSLARALELDPEQPVAAIGQARLAILDRDWERAIELLTPVLDEHPRLSMCHRYLAVAYEHLGDEARRDHHQAFSEYGSALDSPMMRELHELAVPPIVDGGDAARGPALVQEKCARCHTRGRIDETDGDRRWWAATVRRMQREAGWEWLTDEEAASVVAYLANGG